MRLHDVKLSENFCAGEFRCRGDEKGESCSCRGAILVRPELVDVLQAWRNEVGPIHPTNAFRCHAWNEYVRGHERSYHRVGGAIDCTSRKIAGAVTMYESDGLYEEEVVQCLAGICEALQPDRCNIIVYPRNGFIHLDIGRRVAGALIRTRLPGEDPKPWTYAEE